MLKQPEDGWDNSELNFLVLAAEPMSEPTSYHKHLSGKEVIIFLLKVQ